jgi:hypothetical protein
MLKLTVVMYPDQAPSNPPPSTTPIDYLNQISTQPAKKGFTGKKQKIILGALGVIVVIIIIAVIGALLRPNNIPSEQLAAKLQTTQSIATAAQPTIESSQLRAFNSNLTIYLTNSIRDIRTPLLNNGIDITKLDKSVVSSESGTAITGRLEDARLNAVYDTTYAREIAYQLDLILSLMQQINSTTSSKSLKTFLQSSYNNLTPIQKQFEDYNNANS